MHKTVATTSIHDTSADKALPADKSTTQFLVQTRGKGKQKLGTVEGSSEIYPTSTLDRNKEAVGLLNAMEQKTRSAEQESFLGEVMLGLLYAMEKKTRSAEHESLLGDVMLRLLNAMEKKTRSAEHESFLGEVMLGLLNAMEKKTRRAEHESSLDKVTSGCTFDVYIGLPNEGNTCFLNTLLQCLFLTPEFRDKLSECENNSGKTLLAVEKIFNAMKEKERQYITTRELTACLGLQPFKQQDVPEVFLLLLNKLDEELSNGSYFKELYASTTVNLTECTQCETKDGLDMECNIVILPLPVSSVRSREKPWSVADALEHFLRSSEMKGENQIYCAKCSGKTDATLRQALTSLPRILVLQLKRFEFRFYEQSFVKLENEMHINTTLEVPCEKTSQKDKKSYDLFAICDHYGGFKSGHYSALIKPEENGKWFRFNDSTVTSEEIEISDPEIRKSFWKASSGNTYDLSSSRTAYMLMYRQKLQRKPQKSEDATVPAYQRVPQPRTGSLRNADRTSEGKEVRSRSRGALSTGASLATAESLCNAERMSEGKEVRSLSWGTMSTEASLATEGETTPPDQQPVLEDRSVGDDFLPSTNEDTFQQPLDSTETSSPVKARGDSITGSPEGPPPTEHAPTARQIPSMDSEDPQVVFERQAIGAHQQLVDESWVGLETIAGTLEGVCRGLSPNKDTYETFKNTYPSLQRMEQSLADIASVMRQRQQQQPWQCDTSEIATQLEAIHTIFQSMEQKQDSYIATMRAFHHDIVALLINHQALFSAVLLTLLAQTNAAGDRGATSSAPDVCVPQMPPAQTQLTSEEEEVDLIKF